MKILKILLLTVLALGAGVPAATGQKGLPQVDSLLNLAYRYLYNNPDRAMQIIQQAKVVAFTSKHGISIGNVERMIGNVYYVTDRYDSALYYYQRSVETYRQLNDTLGMGASINNIGTILHDRGDFEKALDHYNRAIQMKLAVGNERSTSSTWINIGQIENNLGRYTASIKSFDKAIEIAAKYQDSARVLEAIGPRATSLLSLKLSNTALSEFRRAIKLAGLLNDKLAEGNGYYNIGRIYYARGNSDSALYVMQKAYDLYEEVDSESSMGSTLETMAQVNMMQGKEELAKTQLEKALEIFTRLGELRSQAYCYKTLGDLMMDMDRYGEALSFYNVSRPLARQLKLVELERTVYSGKYNAFLSLGDYDSANYHLNLITQLSDSLSNLTDMPLVESALQKPAAGTSLHWWQPVTVLLLLAALALWYFRNREVTD